MVIFRCIQVNIFKNRRKKLFTVIHGVLVIVSNYVFFFRASNTGMTPLLEAVQNSNEECAIQLLKYGALWRLGDLVKIIFYSVIAITKKATQQRHKRSRKIVHFLALPCAHTTLFQRLYNVLD